MPDVGLNIKKPVNQKGAGSNHVIWMSAAGVTCAFSNITLKNLKRKRLLSVHNINHKWTANKTEEISLN